jgi:pyrimidine-specific ribonucleoside hydrolase
MLTIKEMPRAAEAYQPETAALVRAGVPERFGPEEWTSVVLTQELHQHVGIYTVLGAKMGVRARELLQAPTRSVDVTCECGAKQPLSCAIDGLQAALGSTMGQNLIHIAPDREASIAATFQYNGQKLRLSLKPEVEQRIGAFIRKAIEEHGNLTPAYFEAVEAYSYRVWAEFDRREIFAQEALTGN